MSVPTDTTTERFLQLIDRLDAEANVVTHVIARTTSTVREVLADAYALLDGPPDLRQRTEVTVRLLQHRARLVASLSTLAGSGALPPGGRSHITPAASLPVPPKPARPQAQVEALGREAGRSPEAPSGLSFRLPEPPRLRS